MSALGIEEKLLSDKEFCTTWQHILIHTVQAEWQPARTYIVVEAIILRPWIPAIDWIFIDVIAQGRRMISTHSSTVISFLDLVRLETGVVLFADGRADE